MKPPERAGTALRSAYFIAIQEQSWPALGVVGLIGRGRGPRPRESRPGGLEASCDAAEQLGVGASGGKRDAHPRRGLGDAGCDLDQVQPQGGELRTRQVPRIRGLLNRRRQRQSNR